MFQIIFVFFIIFINGANFYRLESFIRNLENEDNGFIVDKPLLLKQYYESITNDNNNNNDYHSPSIFKKSTEPKYNQHLSDFVSKNIMQMAMNIQSQIISDKSSYISQSVFSPISIAGALSLLLLGSTGKTHQELTKLFGFKLVTDHSRILHNQFGLLIEDLLREFPHPQRQRPVSKWKYLQRNDENNQNSNNDFHFRSRRDISNLNDDYKIEIANGLFIQKELKLRQKYQMMVKSIYHSEIMSVDFHNDLSHTCQLINEWTKKRTNGKINEIISSGLHPDTTMVIASALYFKAMWSSSFIETATSKREFYPNGDSDEISSSILVDTMINVGEFPYYEDQEHDFRILGIPFKGNLSTMYIILPNQSSRDRIIELQQQLNSNQIENLIEKMEKRTAILTFPKMHIQNSINLKNIFIKMGMTSLFNTQESDLSLMLDENPEATEEADYAEPYNHNLRRKRTIIARDPKLRQRFYKFLQQQQQQQHHKMPLELENESPIREGKKVFVDDILHKVDLTLNEKGTEGGATTITYVSRSDIEIDFIVNKPFIFFIRHDATKLPIFYGTVFKPIN